MTDQPDAIRAKQARIAVEAHSPGDEDQMADRFLALLFDMTYLAKELGIIISEHLESSYVNLTGPVFISYNLVTGAELIRSFNQAVTVDKTVKAAKIGYAGTSTGLYYEVIQFNGELPDPGALLYETIGIGTPLYRDFVPHPKSTLAN